MGKLRLFNLIPDEKLKQMCDKYKAEIHAKYLSKKKTHIGQLEAYDLFSELHHMGVMLGFYCTLALDYDPHTNLLSGHLYVSYYQSTKGAKLFTVYDSSYHRRAVEVIDYYENNLLTNHHERQRA